MYVCVCVCVCVCVRACTLRGGWMGLEGCSSQRKKGSLHGPVNPPQRISPENLHFVSFCDDFDTAGAHARYLASFHHICVLSTLPKASVCLGS